MSDKPMYWFNIKTKQVEKGLLSRSTDRIGPFETEAEAKNAEQLVKLRSEKWREEERLED